MRRVENLTPQYGLLVLLLPHANEVVGVVVGVKKKKTRHRSIWSFHSETFYSIQVKERVSPHSPIYIPSNLHTHLITNKSPHLSLVSLVHH